MVAIIRMLLWCAPEQHTRGFTYHQLGQVHDMRVHILHWSSPQVPLCQHHSSAPTPLNTHSGRPGSSSLQVQAGGTGQHCKKQGSERPTSSSTKPFLAFLRGLSCRTRLASRMAAFRAALLCSSVCASSASSSSLLRLLLVPEASASLSSASSLPAEPSHSSMPPLPQACSGSEVLGSRSSPLAHPAC